MPACALSLEGAAALQRLQIDAALRRAAQCLGCLPKLLISEQEVGLAGSEAKQHQVGHHRAVHPQRHGVGIAGMNADLHFLQQFSDPLVWKSLPVRGVDHTHRVSAVLPGTKIGQGAVRLHAVQTDQQVGVTIAVAVTASPASIRAISATRS